MERTAHNLYREIARQSLGAAISAIDAALGAVDPISDTVPGRALVGRLEQNRDELRGLIPSLPEWAEPEALDKDEER